MFYKFHWTTRLEQRDMKDSLHPKRGREHLAATRPGGEGGLASQHGQGPRETWACRELGWVKGSAAVLVGEVTTANAHVTWLLWLCCLLNLQLTFSIPNFIPFFFYLSGDFFITDSRYQKFSLSQGRKYPFMKCHVMWRRIITVLLLWLNYLDVSCSYSTKTWLFKTKKKQNKVLSKPFQGFVFHVGQTHFRLIRR